MTMLVATLLPGLVHVIETCETDMNTAVNRGTGGGENPYYTKGLIVVLDETFVAGAVRDNDFIAKPVTEVGGYLGTEHGFVLVFEPVALA